MHMTSIHKSRRVQYREAFVHLISKESKIFSHFTLGPQDQSPAPQYLQPCHGYRTFGDLPWTEKLSKDDGFSKHINSQGPWSIYGKLPTNVKFLIPRLSQMRMRNARPRKGLTLGLEGRGWRHAQSRSWGAPITRRTEDLTGLPNRFGSCPSSQLGFQAVHHTDGTGMFPLLPSKASALDFKAPGCWSSSYFSEMWGGEGAAELYDW